MIFDELTLDENLCFSCHVPVLFKDLRLSTLNEEADEVPKGMMVFPVKSLFETKSSITQLSSYHQTGATKKIYSAFLKPSNEVFFSLT